MTRTLLTAALLAATATTALAAASYSPPKILRTAGNWTATFYERGTNGLPLCVAARKLDKGRYFGLKSSASGSFLHLSKSGWRIPVGTKVSVTLAFDDAEPMMIAGTVMSNPLTDDAVIYVLLADRHKQFMESFATSTVLNVSFPDGSEQPWSVRMTGSREMTAVFTKCTADIQKNITQPFGRPQPSKNDDDDDRI